MRGSGRGRGRGYISTGGWRPGCSDTGRLGTDLQELFFVEDEKRSRLVAGGVHSVVDGVESVRGLSAEAAGGMGDEVAAVRAEAVVHLVDGVALTVALFVGFLQARLGCGRVDAGVIFDVGVD